MNRLKLTLPAATVTLLLSLALPSLPAATRAAGAQRLSPQRQLLFDIYKELVETNTTDSVGNTTEAAEKVAARLRAAGFAAERSTVLTAGGSYVDVTPWICSPITCAVVLGNLLIYRDDNHLSTHYVTWLTPAVEEAVTLASTSPHAQDIAPAEPVS